MAFETIPLPKDIQRPPETVLVNITPQETRVAVLEENDICELHIERNSEHSLVGNIYLGVVRRVLPGMQSAFIEIGLERAAFLHIMDVVEQRQNPDSNQRIEQVLFEGQSILVQVIKDPINSKGARLSTQISLAGRFLVHLPQDDHIGISQRIENEEDREVLRQRLIALLPENASHGYILRTSAETATDSQLQADINYLTKVWHNIQTAAQTSPPQSLLYQDLPLAQRVLRDMFNDNTREILVDSRRNFDKMKQFADLYVQQAADKLHQFRGERPLFEACHAIARELRLRNLGGIIIIDFIDMIQEEHRDAVLQELAKALSLDRTRVTLNGFTSLGLVELTRKRSRESLKQVLCEPCPTCSGRGSLKTTQTLCYEIQREIVRESRRFDVREFRIIASAQVIDLFLDEESQSLAMLIDFIGKPISLSVETSYTQEQYDIVLL